ncbi:MAG TPA: methylamine dehydrogenase accessory protein MauD, partial [Candidatus Binataceae bacterium]|nr:methylamine dehydrogenase accessory protein MauD [Candidatus Binataceae bacterium]
MHDALAISQVVLWVVVVALAATVLALARQIGVLHERIAPMGALTMDKGPKVGDVAPVFDLRALNRAPVTIGGASAGGFSTMLMFVSPTCPVCKKLLPIVKSIADSESRWLRVIFTSDGDEPEQKEFVERYRLDSFPMVLSSELGMTYRVSKLPYAVLIDEEGRVRAKGLVNTREHLESIIQAKQMGVASIQDYLRARQPAEPVAVANGERG